MKTKKLKPKFYSLSSCGYEVIYRCCRCSRVFRMIDDSFNYCPKCGSKIDWGVIIEVNAEFKNKYLNAIKPYFDDKGEWHGENPQAQECRDYIDSINLTINDGCKRKMPQTELTKQEIIKSNIGYYIGNGWTKEELIKQGFFSEEDFDQV